MSGPLEGLSVIDLTRLQPGNYATLLMADLGADVVKVEEPGRGDYVRWMPPIVEGSSAMHHAMNRNKRSVTLNLKDPRGVELLHRLVEGADVLIESFRPGVLERLGAGYTKLSGINPGLVYASITGYGQTGPYRDRVGHDINYVALTGVLDQTGQAGGPPVLPGVQIADLAGAMMAVISVLAAVTSRQSSGRGEHIDVSMADAALSWTALHISPWLAGDVLPQRGRGYLNGGFPFYRLYSCSDGKFISVGALEPKFWETLCGALGRPDLAHEQMAPEPRRSELHAVFEEIFASKTRDEWVAILGNLEVCVAPVNDFAEARADPQLTERGMFLSESELPGVGIPVKLKNRPGEVLRTAPALGEHNAEVYGALGISRSEIDDLEAAKVI